MAWQRALVATSDRGCQTEARALAVESLQWCEHDEMWIHQEFAYPAIQSLYKKGQVAVSINDTDVSPRTRRATT